MRTYGRVWATNPDGTRVVPQPPGYPFWTEVQTDANGFDDYVWLTTLLQCLKLELGESPFYAQYGIPSKPSVVQQSFPDFFVSRTQQQFAPRFASLVVAKRPTPDPTYDVNVVTHQGVRVAVSIAA
jgi:hypothetical protein